MKRILKWTVMGLAGAAVVVLLGAVGMLLATDMRLAKTYTVAAPPLPVAGDGAAIARGATWRRCTVRAAMASSWRAGHSLPLRASAWWMRPTSRAAAAASAQPMPPPTGCAPSVMGSGRTASRCLSCRPATFSTLARLNLGALIAYLKHVPPVDNQTRARTFTPLARILYTAGAFGSQIPAERIDHKADWPTAPEVGPTAEYGAYIVTLGGCRTCHGADLGGGRDGDPKAPPAPNLTPGGELRGWQEADFFKAMRVGATPEGRGISDFMPWRALGRLADDELRALWRYLQATPPVAG